MARRMVRGLTANEEGCLDSGGVRRGISSEQHAVINIQHQINININNYNMAVSKAVKEELSKITDSINNLSVAMSGRLDNVDKKLDAIEKLDESINKLGEKVVGMEASIKSLEQLEESNRSEIVEIKKLQGALTNKLQDNVVRIDNNVKVLEQQDITLTQKNLDLSESVNNINTSIVPELRGKIISLEKTLHGNLQHERLAQIEIDGVPNNIGDKKEDLEVAILSILGGINVACTSKDIEAVHR